MFAIGPAAFGSHAVCLPVGSELRSSKPGVREPYCSPRGVLRLKRRELLFGEAREFTAKSYSCSTGAAKKNDRRQALPMCVRQD